MRVTKTKVESTTHEYDCDIGIGRKFGIEVKKDLDDERQVDDFLRDFDKTLDSYGKGVIFGLIGEADEQAYEKFVNEAEDMASGGLLGGGKRVEVILKEH